MRQRFTLLILGALLAVSCGSSAEAPAEAAIEDPASTSSRDSAEPTVFAESTVLAESAAPVEPAVSPMPEPTATTPAVSEPAAPSAAEAAPPEPEPFSLDYECELVQGAAGSPGAVELATEVVVDGLEVPWSVAFLPGGDWLLTERPGRVRLVSGGELAADPVLTIDVSIPAPLFGIDTLGSEGGLLGILLHPDFELNRQFYLFHNAQKAGAEISRIDRFVLSDDHRSASFESNILDDIPAGVHHQGGRMHIGPDGMLYVGVGAWIPELAQDPGDLTGKLLRMGLDGEIPSDNPDPASYVFVSGIRNTQGFDWFDDDHILMIDHGPSGFELDMPELRGFDEINIARAGDNLGWPVAWGCDPADGALSPLVSFETSVPPTGATFYRGNLIPQWQGRFLVSSVGAAQPRSNGRHLHVIEFAPDDPSTIVSREVYLPDAFGRLRTVVEADDGSVLVMTSNCDNRGFCPSQGDAIIRITPA